MSMKVLALAAAAGLLASLAVIPAADAQGKRAKRDQDTYAERDCTPFNGPHGYYGNPWCDGGWKNAEDYAPGTGPYFDLLDLPQLRRLEERWRY